MTHAARSSSSRSNRNSRTKSKDGTATRVNSRVAKSGNYAHSCAIGAERFTLFSEDEFCPFSDGDMVSFEYEIRTLRSGSRSSYNSIVPESLRLTMPAEMSERVSGHIYILSNSSMSGLLKIGFTNGEPAKRAAELSGVTGVPTPFRLEWSMPIIGNARAVEQRIHAVLSTARHGKEFFRVSLDEAQAVAQRCYVELYPETAVELEGVLTAVELAAIERRRELAAEHERRDRERREQEELEAFEKSPAQVWKRSGSYSVRLRDFSETPRRGKPGFIGRLLGRHYPEWVQVRIYGSVQPNELPWKVSINGLVGGDFINQTALFQRLEDALYSAQWDADALCRKNQSWQISFSNAMVVEPTPPPEYVRPNTVMELSDWPKVQLAAEFGSLPISS